MPLLFHKKFSEEQFRHAITNNVAIAGVLRELNIPIAGASYSFVNRKVKELNLDTSHWTGKGWHKGMGTWHPLRPLSEVLIEFSDISSTFHLKNRLLKEGLLKNECYECHINEWRGKKLMLELDHINGVRHDNRLDNLQLLCPNCHSQTDTYCGKNKRKAA